jgi:hypothetical protein
MKDDMQFKCATCLCRQAGANEVAHSYVLACKIQTLRVWILQKKKPHPRLSKGEEPDCNTILFVKVSETQSPPSGDLGGLI